MLPVWKRSWRWQPFWIGALLLAPVTIGTAAVLLSVAGSTTSILQMPLFAVMIYGCLVLLLNGTTVEVDQAGATVRRGPLFSGARTRHRFGKSEVRRLMLWDRAGYKGVRECRAAAELASGEWVQISETSPEPERAAECLRDIARIWDWPGEIAHEGGWPAKRDTHGGLVVLGWGAVFILAILWNVVIELAG